MLSYMTAHQMLVKKHAESYPFLLSRPFLYLFHLLYSLLLNEVKI